MSNLLIRCRTCGSQNQQQYIFAKDFNQEKSDELFSYYLCNDCRSIFLHPVPNNLSFYYGQNYPAYAVKNTKKIENNLNYLEHAKLDIVKKYAPPGKLVEVGPAAGRFLSVASQAGYEVLGIEQDAECVSHIKDALNLDVRCSDNPTDQLLQLVSCCDVIVAWHVIEHLQDLRGFMAAASKALRKPNGVIIVSAPNPDAWSFKVFRRYWVHLDAPRHLTLIPLQALDKLMAEQGLERVACIFDDPVGLQLNKMGWQSSLMNLTCNDILRWPFLAGFGKIIAITMSLFDRIQGKGAAYTAIYKNKNNVG